MTNIVNLNKVRKTRSRAAKKAQAAENSVKFGLTKSQKSFNKASTTKTDRDLDDKATFPDSKT